LIPSTPCAPHLNRHCFPGAADTVAPPQSVAELAVCAWPDAPGPSPAKPLPQQQPGYDSGALELASSPRGGLGWPAWSRHHRTWPRAVATASASSTAPITFAKVGARVVGVVRLAIGVGAGLRWPAWRSSAIATALVRAGVAGGPAHGKEANGEGLICISADYMNSVVGLGVNHR